MGERALFVGEAALHPVQAIWLDHLPIPSPSSLQTNEIISRSRRTNLLSSWKFRGVISPKSICKPE